MVVNVSDFKSKRVLITGASGYLATHCVKQLLAAGYVVRGTVRCLNNVTKVKPLTDLPYASERLELVEADLDNEASWIPVVKGCTYVLHTASPFTVITNDSLIATAVNGTLAVLKACARESSIKKVVVTSSGAAISEGHDDGNHVFTEEDWSIEAKIKQSYPRSKTAAERAAWNYVNTLTEVDNKFALTCINPGFMVGPVLGDTIGFSISIVRRLLNNEMPAVPALSFPCVDVRDCARAHILAMSSQESDGERIIASYQPSLWLNNMAQILAKEFKPQGYSISTFQPPKFLLSILSCFDSEIKDILPIINREFKYNNSKAKNLLGIEFHNPETALIEMAYSMIERGMVPKKRGYRKKVF